MKAQRTALLVTENKDKLEKFLHKTKKKTTKQKKKTKKQNKKVDNKKKPKKRKQSAETIENGQETYATEDNKVKPSRLINTTKNHIAGENYKIKTLILYVTGA